MNEFGKRFSALRRQFKAEERQITKDAYREIAQINLAISKTDSEAVRDILRAGRERVFELMRRSHEINKTCYMQQLELIADEQRLFREKNPSKLQLRRFLACLCKLAEKDGKKTFSISFGDHRHAEVTFS